MVDPMKLVAKTAALFFCCVLFTVEGRRLNGGTTFGVKEGLSPVGTSGPDSPTSPYGTMTLIAQHFWWAENLIFDGTGNLLVSDARSGIIFLLTRDPTTKTVTKTAWIQGFDEVLGLAVNTYNSSQVFFVYKKSGITGVGFFSSAPSSIGDWWPVWTTDTIGNGLTQCDATGIVYTACEGAFLPYQGRVFSMAIESAPNVTGFVDELYSTDGAFIAQSQQVLFISDVVGATVRAYNVSAPDGGEMKGKKIAEYVAPGMKTLDDFTTLEVNGTLLIVGADFLEQKVVAFQAFPQGSTPPFIVLATGFRGNPTSVRVGSGPGWVTSSPQSKVNLYISEGGPFLPGTYNRFVWELDVPLSVFAPLLY